MMDIANLKQKLHLNLVTKNMKVTKNDVCRLFTILRFWRYINHILTYLLYKNKLIQKIKRA